MSGGISDLSRWRGEYVFPRHQPVLASWYALRRYVLPKLMNFNANELPPTGQMREALARQFETQVTQLAQATSDKGATTPGILFLYPTKQELETARQGREWLSERPLILSLARKHGLAVADLSTYEAWTTALYRDDVHPTEQGNVVIARMLVEAIQAYTGKARVATASN